MLVVSFHWFSLGFEHIKPVIAEVYLEMKIING